MTRALFCQDGKLRVRTATGLSCVVGLNDEQYKAIELYIAESKEAEAKEYERLKESWKARDLAESNQHVLISRLIQSRGDSGEIVVDYFQNGVKKSVNISWGTSQPTAVHGGER